MIHGDPYEQCPTQIENVRPKFKVLRHLSNHFHILISNTVRMCVGMYTYIYSIYLVYILYRLNEFLPKEYVKVKGIEKIVYQEHRKHFSMSELSAKYRYITKCRSMPTYGVTFFLVKEKLKGRNKLVPRLLGISRSSVMRVDENTKEVLQRWELTSVKRWAASTNSFTLDFGDYREGYYSVQTSEGESVSQLLGNYIDLILKDVSWLLDWYWKRVFVAVSLL